MGFCFEIAPLVTTETLESQFLAVESEISALCQFYLITLSFESYFWATLLLSLKNNSCGIRVCIYYHNNHTKARKAEEFAFEEH